jgi:hypothetical protein
MIWCSRRAIATGRLPVELWYLSTTILKPTNWSPLGFEAQTKKPSRWFWGPNHQTRATGFELQIGKLLILVLSLNQETYAPRLLVHGTDCTRCHPTSRSSGHQVPELCLTIPSPLHQVTYSCLDPRRYLPCLTCHLHTTRQANTILHMNQDKDKNHWNVPDLNSNLGMSMTHHNQTKELTTWFLTVSIWFWPSNWVWHLNSTYIRPKRQHT